MSMGGPAVLSSALMARKGSAAPTGYTAMRPQDVNVTRSANENAGNPSPVTKPPVTTAAATDIRGPTSTDSRRMRVSVRLDRERHLKLKLTSAHLQNSLQDIIVDALDRYLEQISPEVLRSECACLGINNPDLKNAAAPHDWQSD